MMRKLGLWWRWALVIMWMAVIFFFSHQVGEDSGGLSDSIVNWLYSLGIHISSETLSFLVRKAAHMSEYAVLAILLFVALRGSHGQRLIEPRNSQEPRESHRLEKRAEARGYQALISAFVISVIYAATDEFHQLFIPGRTGTPKDVLIDSAGAAIGLALAWLVSRRRPH